MRGSSGGTKYIFISDHSPNQNTDRCNHSDDKGLYHCQPPVARMASTFSKLVSTFTWKLVSKRKYGLTSRKYSRTPRKYALTPRRHALTPQKYSLTSWEDFERILLRDFEPFSDLCRHWMWPGEGSTVQWKWSPPAPGSLKALLFPPLLNKVQTRERKGYKRGTAQNFHWAWIMAHLPHRGFTMILSS